VDAVVHAHERGGGAIAIELGFDPARESGGVVTTPVVRDPSIAPALPAPDLPRNGGPFTFDLVLAGSEVIRAGAVEELRDLADRTGLGVLNVFTAKGLFRWDSPYHLGTAGLQLHDFALAGLATNRPILAVGVGLDECPDAILRDAGLSPDGAWPVTRVAIERLGSVGNLVRAAHDGPPAPGELYQRLSGVAQPLYREEDVPLNPARAAADVGESLPEGGVVTLEPSTAGWWVARTLPTTQLGSVRVPAAARPGLAVAAALLASIEGKPAVAVVEAPVGPENRALIELARSRDADLVVAVWGDDGDITSPEGHRDQLRAALAKPGVTELRVPVSFAAATRLLIEAAGPLAAWGA
jgi:nucleotide-binding universal stress UspA family protein